MQNKQIKFLVLSRAQAEDKHVQGTINQKHILISINGTTGSDSTPALIPDNENRVDMLQICFDDIDNRDMQRDSFDKINKKYDFNLFSESHARNILNFVEKNIENIELIVVHCFAGVSRSVACASALSKILNNNDDKIFKSGCPNMKVYTTILEKFFLSCYNELWPKITEINFNNTEYFN